MCVNNVFYTVLITCKKLRCKKLFFTRRPQKDFSFNKKKNSFNKRKFLLIKEIKRNSFFAKEFFLQKKTFFAIFFRIFPGFPKISQVFPKGMCVVKKTSFLHVV